MVATTSTKATKATKTTKAKANEQAEVTPSKYEGPYRHAKEFVKQFLAEFDNNDELSRACFFERIHAMRSNLIWATETAMDEHFRGRLICDVEQELESKTARLEAFAEVWGITTFRAEVHSMKNDLLCFLEDE